MGEAKALMEQILASNGSKEEIASRVEALLAGSELSSSRGVNGGIDGTNLSEARSRRGGLPMDPMARPGQQGGSLADRIRARNAAKEGGGEGQEGQLLQKSYRTEKSQGADDGLLLRRLLQVFQSLQVLRCRGSPSGRGI